MSLKKLHFYFYTSHSPAITWTRTCGFRKQTVSRETCKIVMDLLPALLMPRHRKTRLVSLSEGKHMVSAWWREAATDSSCAAPLCWVAVAVEGPDVASSPGWSSQLCLFPVASCCSKILAWLSWAPCFWRADASVHCPSPLSSSGGDADHLGMPGFPPRGLLPPLGGAGQGPSSRLISAP